MKNTIGLQRHLLTLMVRHVEKKPGGTHENIYHPVGQIFGQIMPLKAREVLIAMGNQIEVTHRIRVRYDTRIEPYMRLGYGKRTFDVTSIINEDEADRFLILYAREKAQEASLEKAV